MNTTTRSKQHEPEVRVAEIVREYGPYAGAAKVGGVSYDGTYVWAATGGRLLAIDPASGNRAREIDHPGDAGTAFDGKHLWQIAEARIDKIDPDTGDVLASIPAPGSGSDSGLAWAEGSLWVGQYRDRRIHRIDPATGTECPPARFGDDGELLNAGEATGEIVNRKGAPMFEGYYNNPEATAERLRRAGIHTVADLEAVAEGELVRLLGQAQGHGLWQLARAQDSRPVVSEREAKSISVEGTYDSDLTDRKLMEGLLSRQAREVGTRMRKNGISGRTVTIKVRLYDFTTLNRSSTLTSPTDDGATIARIARSLLADLDTTGGVRLLGVGVSGLADWVQEDLFGETAESAERELELLALQDDMGDDEAWMNSFTNQLNGGGGDPVDEELEGFQLQLPEGI